MANRLVTRTGKDEDGDITSLCNSTAEWSPRAKANAIRDIENEDHRYYVLDGSQQVDVHVVNGASGLQHLRTDPDKTSRNNLDDLPDC